MFAPLVYRSLHRLLYRFRFVLFAALLPTLFAFSLRAQSSGSLHGKIVDPLGSPVPNAKIVLLQDASEIANAQSAADGSFELKVPAAGDYGLQVEATGFATQTLPPVYLPSGKIEEQTITLHVGPLTQQVVVSATGTATPQAQVGASVTLIDKNQITTLNKLDVLEDLRLVPGAQIVQTGERGGTTSLLIEGGESDFNKVIVDGIPVNEIGGDFDFAQLSNSGVGSVEVLRGSNSVLYGADALSGVVLITSERGTTSTPELQVSVDGGNFGTLNENVSLGGTFHQLDYFSEFSRFDTKGSYPNDFFHNATGSLNFGWDINPTTGLRITVRHESTDLGSPNGILFYGISDDAGQWNQNTYVGVTAQQQTTDRWHNSVQFAFGQFNSVYDLFTPSGESFDPYAGTPYDTGPNYLGNVVTIRGANGYSVTGQAILDYGGTYPMVSPDYEARRSVYAESDYRFFGDWTGTAGFRYEYEDGEGLTRVDETSYVEGHGSVHHRFFLTAGLGLDDNSVYGFAASPRVSAAYYLRKSSGAGFFNDTKLKANFGKGIKEPSTYEQAAALYAVLTPAQIAQYDVSPIGPERSKTSDFGIEQGLWNRRASLGITYFYNDFYNLISFLDESDLVSIGVPPGAAEATPFGGGAYVNATSERALGTELEFKTYLGHGLTFQGDYAYLDAVVTKAFGEPSFNPLFPNIPIGAFDPLEGARPFHQAPYSGSLLLTYTHKKFTSALTGYFVSRRDDSTFLEDGYFGNTMLLPNRNLAPGYQKIDLSGSYALNPHVKIYTSIENLLSEHYQSVFGFPAAPFEIRSGVTFTLGGNEGWWK
jgi:iron complex outermembrane receptor protein/vitamin B12 transporter